MRDAYLLDTNILLRLTERTDRMVREALRALVMAGARLLITGQNLIEFWNVATRPGDKNGLGLTTDEAARELARHRAAFELLPDEPRILEEWQTLVVRYNVEGKQAHDARLAAVALVHGATYFLTLNGQDFQRYTPEGLVIVDPKTILEASHEIRNRSGD